MEERIPDPGPLAACAVAQIANGYMIELSEELRTRPDERSLGLLCECGCLRIVETTRAEYKALGGAWLTGHGPAPPATTEQASPAPA